MNYIPEDVNKLPTDKFYCAICDEDIDRDELDGFFCPYCQTEIPEAVEEEQPRG